MKWIKINDGEIFEGDENMLLDCFGVYVYQLEDFCEHALEGATFTIDEVKNHDV